METNDIILTVAGVGIISAWSMIGMGFYIKKHLIKQADMVFLGFEAPSDSIFFAMLRANRYAMLFSWSWHAKRTGELEKAGQFDDQFQRPFKLFLWLLLISSICGVVTMILLKMYHPNYANE